RRDAGAAQPHRAPARVHRAAGTRADPQGPRGMPLQQDPRGGEARHHLPGAALQAQETGDRVTMKKPMTRWKAAAIHLLISIVVITGVGLGLMFVWYGPELFA